MPKQEKRARRELTRSPAAHSRSRQSVAAAAAAHSAFRAAACASASSPAAAVARASAADALFAKRQTSDAPVAWIWQAKCVRQPSCIRMPPNTAASRGLERPLEQTASSCLGFRARQRRQDLLCASNTAGHVREERSSGPHCRTCVARRPGCRAHRPPAAPPPPSPTAPPRSRPQRRRSGPPKRAPPRQLLPLPHRRPPAALRDAPPPRRPPPAAPLRPPTSPRSACGCAHGLQCQGFAMSTRARSGFWKM